MMWQVGHPKKGSGWTPLDEGKMVAFAFTTLPIKEFFHLP